MWQIDVNWRKKTLCESPSISKATRPNVYSLRTGWKITKFSSSVNPLDITWFSSPQTVNLYQGVTVHHKIYHHSRAEWWLLKIPTDRRQPTAVPFRQNLSWNLTATRCFLALVAWNLSVLLSWITMKIHVWWKTHHKCGFTMSASKTPYNQKNKLFLEPWSK